MQVVQLQPAVLEELHQLPVAGLDDADRRGPPIARAGAEVAGEVPVDGVALAASPLASLKQRHEALAVERLLGRRLRAGQLQERREEIDVDRRHVARRARLAIWPGQRTMNGTRMPPS